MTDRLQAATSGSGVREGGFAGWIAGRARRGEYWLWVVPIVLASGVLGATNHPILGVVATVPILFVWIRRLHDLGRTGWWAPAINVVSNVSAWIMKFAIPGDTGVLLGALPSLFALIALGCIPPQARDNEFGPGPGRKADLKETFG